MAIIAEPDELLLDQVVSDGLVQRLAARVADLRAELNKAELELHAAIIDLQTTLRQARRVAMGKL